jgi:hypothetical protein
MDIKRKILKARANLKRRREAAQKESAHRSERQAYRAARGTERKAELTARHVASLSKRREAEEALATQKTREREALVGSREARKARLLTEKELEREKYRPYTDVAKKIGAVGKEVGKVVVGVAKVPYQGLKCLAKESDKYEREHPTPKKPKSGKDDFLDFGKIDL